MPNISKLSRSMPHHHKVEDAKVQFDFGHKKLTTGTVGTGHVNTRQPVTDSKMTIHPTEPKPQNADEEGAKLKKMISELQEKQVLLS